MSHPSGSIATRRLTFAHSELIGYETTIFNSSQYLPSSAGNMWTTFGWTTCETKLSTSPIFILIVEQRIWTRGWRHKSNATKYATICRSSGRHV